MLPSLASLADFEVRLPGGIPAGDESRAQANLDDASALIRADAGISWVDELGQLDDVPDVVVSVMIAVARRAFVNPDMVRAESIDGYSTSYAASSPDVYLTKAEKNLIRRAAGRTGLWTQATTRLDVDEQDLPSVYPDLMHGDSVEESDPFGESWGTLP